MPVDYLDEYAEAIAAIESEGSGGYYAIGPRTRTGDRAIGKYQVMASNVPEWTQAALGYPMSPRQFLNDQAAQDAVFRQRFGSYVQQYGNPQDAASVWFTGRPMSRGGGASDGYINGYEYVRRFNRALARGPASVSGPVDIESLGDPLEGEDSSHKALTSPTSPTAKPIDYEALGDPVDAKADFKVNSSPPAALDQKSSSPPGASQLDAQGNEKVVHFGGVPGAPADNVPLKFADATPPVSNQSGLDQIRMDPGLPPDPKSQAGQPAMTTIGIRGYAEPDATNIKGFPANSPTSMRQSTTPPSVTIPRRPTADELSGKPTDSSVTSYGHGGSGPGADAPNQINPLKVDDAGYSSIADITKVQRQLGQNADWDKFEREARPSTNVEDKRETDYTVARQKREANAMPAASDYQAAGQDTFASKDREQDLSDVGLTMPKDGPRTGTVPMPRARPYGAPQRLSDDGLPGWEVPYEEYAA